ncbi:MAG: ABC transporter permease, partial [Burkholderiales bacterium]
MSDLTYALRMLVKDRWFTLVALLALGLGIGLNATVFTIVNAVLIRGLPFHDPEQILHLNARNNATSRRSGVSWLDFQDLRGQTKTFAHLGAYRPGNFTVTEQGRPPERILGVSVSANTFALLGQEPLRGRVFLPGEDGNDAAPVVILGYGVWQSRYGGDEAIVGRVIKVNDVACTVIGVMPEGMRFPNNAELWRPLAAEGEDLTRRDARSLNLFG